MADAASLRHQIDAYLSRMADEEEVKLLRISRELAPLCAQLRSSLSQGKRMRAAFLYWGWRASGQPHCDGIIQAAAAMELVHAAACVHDDIIDDSRLRHGLPTAHVAFGQAGASGQRRQDRPTALAMMLGDLLMGYAAQVFATCGLPGAYVARTVPLWSELLRETVAGEFLEVQRTGSALPEVAESLEVARYKTAKYTVERPLHLGATLGGASRRVLAAFTDYGLPLGEAFQLRDDLLGTFGDPAQTGKSNLDDLRDGKPTTLLALTASLLPDVDRPLLRKAVGGPWPGGEADMATVRRLMEHSGARRRVEDMIAERLELAHKALDAVPIPGIARAALGALASTSADRSL